MLLEAWGAAVTFARLAHRRSSGKEVLFSRVMSAKRGNKNYYKGKGVPNVGKLTRKGRARESTERAQRCALGYNSLVA